MEFRTVLERLAKVDCTLKSSCNENESQCLECLNNKDNLGTHFVSNGIYNAVKLYMENEHQKE